MNTDLRQNAEKYNKRYRLRRLWQRVLTVLSCIVVFCTTYALILPAITQERATFCGKEPHIHNERCYQKKVASDANASRILVCSLPEFHQHIHDENCYMQTGEHVHDETCYEDGRGELLCELTGIHVHEDSCYEAPELVCAIEEHHVHGEDCYSEPELVCTCTATDSNAHSDSCYAERELLCQKEENHVHQDSCYNRTLLCREGSTEGKEEGHIHDDFCYEQIQVLVCGVTEGTSEKILICEEPEIQTHTHTDDCYELSVQEPAENESSGDVLICELEEHTHGLICYSDPDADLETETVWERTMEDVELTGVWAEDVLAIARTQLGYHESTKNYVVGPDEETKGYTRYGAWYGDEYGDWCAMFVSFCLHYADIEALGFESNCQKWIESLSDEAIGLYHEAGTYQYKAGDLIFFDTDDDGVSNHIGIVADTNVTVAASDSNATDSNAKMIKTIEGNSANRVRYVTYAPEDPTILGFGEMPENPLLANPEKHVHGDTCFDETGKEICGFEKETDLSDEDYYRAAQVIRQIEKLLTADEIDEKIMEFEAAEDYDGEEEWLTEIYQQVARAYKKYDQLPPGLQEYVWNRDKLLELEYIWSVAKLIETEIGQTIAYSAGMFTSEAKYILYTQSGDQFYAFDGYGKAVPVHIDYSGVITADVTDQNELLWTFASQGGNSYTIYNTESRRYMHAFPQDGSSVTSTGVHSSVLEEYGGGIRVRSNSSYAYLDVGSKVFRHTQDKNAAAVYKIGVVYRNTMRTNYVWLDGTNGGLRSLGGSPNISHEVYTGQVITLPTSWQSPDKYSYVLRGWYDVRNGRYYAPGSKVTVTDNMVFYADWVAETYDIGQFNGRVSDAVSTNEFITTRVFDYSTMFNVLSQNVTVNVDGTGHSEQWRLVPKGNVAYNNAPSLGFIFRDYDGGGDITIPSNLDGINTSDDVYPNLYSPKLADILFGTNNSFDPDTGTGVLGKQYLGEADYLFRYGSDPSNQDTYGYYYYDSRLNAASYNQSDERFYVYDYLERTSDSARDGGADGYADFLPLNSPYANTNGKNIRTYQYNGDHGEYVGTNHCMYDVQYNTENCSPNNVGINFWFGMSLELDFYLPNRPGTTDSSGNPGNQSVYGDDMVFEFSGDDDVWVLIDGKLELDIGGIHPVKSGSINFTTGQVIVDGEVVSNVSHIEPGEHTLTLYYLERGSSKSNCKIRFNLSPRYTLTLQKEDVLTRELLNGAEFSVFTDQACTKPAKLWTSRESYNNNVQPTHVFTVQDGRAEIWGFAAGNTYYIRETKSPYGDSILTNGIIKMTLDNRGSSSYTVIADPNTGALSGGFTVHGIKVDYENQEAFLVATNGENVGEVTSISVYKKWNDAADHSATPVTVYLLADGNRIREVTLDSSNDWKFTWENMPKYWSDGTKVNYTVQEGTVPGYLGKIEQMTEDTVISTTWETVYNFTNGGTYLLKTNEGYLATRDVDPSRENPNFRWITDEATAKTSKHARWIATVNGSYISFTNEAGNTIFYDSSCFQASPNPGSNTQFQFRELGIVYGSDSFAGPLTNNVLYTAWWNNNVRNSLKITLLREVAETVSIPVGDNAYLITNSPIAESETVSVQVTKAWDLGTLGTESMYKGLTVHVKLLANEIDTGLTVDLSLRNNWTDSFTWLPKKDEEGRDIVYTVKEVPIDGPWSAEYGEIVLKNGTNNQYQTTITNTCNLTYILPETGGSGTGRYITGAILMIVISMLLLLYKKDHCDREEGRTSL